MGSPKAAVSYRGLPRRSLIYKDLSQLSLPYIALYRSHPPVASSFDYLRTLSCLRLDADLKATSSSSFITLLSPSLPFFFRYTSSDIASD
jgi:hypothetical protein